MQIGRYCSHTDGLGTSLTGGYNGGGSSSAPTDTNYGGGGATDIIYSGSTTPTENDLVWNSALGLNSRIMVASDEGSPRSHANYRINHYSGNIQVYASTYDPSKNYFY